MTKIIEINQLNTMISQQVVHNDLTFSIKRGEIIGLVGASGAGKSVLLRCILRLINPESGQIKMFGEDIHKLDLDAFKSIQQRTGVLFQEGALFSSMTVLENVEFPLKEHTHISHELIHSLALNKLKLVGFKEKDVKKYPSELSGGMKKRASLARSIVLEPEILFLDEPTAGLDPISADSLDDLILSLRQILNLTVLMVSHDLDSLKKVCDRLAVLVDKKILLGTYQELSQSSHPWIKDYFRGNRGAKLL